MSKMNLMARGIAAASAVALTVVGAAWLFPLELAAQTVSDSPGVTVNAGAALLHRTPVLYPAGATVTGTIIVDASVNTKGEVTDARVVSGPEDLRKTVLAGVLNWHYSTQPAPPTNVRVTATFAQAGVGQSALTAPPPPPAPGAGGRGGRGGPVPPGPTIVSAIRTDGLSSELAQRAEAALGVKVGDTLPTPWSPLPKLQAVDEHLRALITRDAEGKATITLSTGTPLVGAVGGPVVVSTAVATRVVPNGTVVSRVAPVYPPIAKEAHVQGIVTLKVLIAKDGTVKEVSVVSGPAMLTQAAADAVKQWIYQPTLLNGQPVETLTNAEVNFTLLQ